MRPVWTQTGTNVYLVLVVYMSLGQNAWLVTWDWYELKDEILELYNLHNSIIKSTYEVIFLRFHKA